MSNSTYITAKTLMDLLPDAQKVKLCNQIIAGVENKKKSRSQRVKDNMKWLDKK